MKTRTSSEHLGWVVSLLTAAVILPTICLVWFMTTAVRNERLAVRQRLIDAYTVKADTLTSFAAQNFARHKEALSLLSRLLTTQSVSSDSFKTFQPFMGVVIYDNSGAQIYPVAGQPSHFDPIEHFPALKTAWEKEFTEIQYPRAIEEYTKLADSNASPAVKQLAMLGIGRCFYKQNNTVEAKAVFKQLAEPASKEGLDETIIAQARLKLVELYARMDVGQLMPYCRKLLESRLADLNLSTETRIYILEQILIPLTHTPPDNMRDLIAASEIFNQLEKSSLQVMEALNPSQIKAYSSDGVYPLPQMENRYAFIFSQDGQRLMGIMDTENIEKDWSQAAAELQDNLVFYRIYDSAGHVAAGQSEERLGQKALDGSLFLTKSAGVQWPGWKIELYFRPDIFQTAAGRQQWLYIWSSVLVIGLMTVFVFLASREILHQAKMNTMKNNFVATVTHELKTPLSSMRLLVDTLLDGNYTNPRQCKEYLELISRENERLSRMIESFLTFSRMERGKQVFEFRPVNPADIVNAAAQAVSTKMNQPGCELRVSMADNLPRINADKDAMVTVLVNLLDNAYKYSGEQKKIELNAQRADDCVCFSVKDNGIGIPRKIQKKIFERFYQADSRLSRNAEGCGLGLSIVKYIADAHKALIEVKSRASAGSEFIIKIRTKAN